MVAEAPTSLGHDGARGARGEGDVSQAEVEAQIAAQRALAIPHGIRDDLRHAGIALDAGRVGRVGQADAHLGEDLVEQVGKHEQVHAGLAQAGQDALDVAQEQPVGADDQHALAGQREPVRVEQVGSAVQRHDGLAGAGTALAHQDALAGAADDLVLLGLDGGHHLAQLTVAALGERGVQRPVSDELGAVAVGGGAVECIEVEDLVFEVRQDPAAAHEMPPAQQSQRVAARSPEERLRDRGSPVDHDGFLPLVCDSEPADVEGLAGAGGVRHLRVGARLRCVRIRCAVDAAEHQRRRAELELAQTPGHGIFDHIAFESGLAGAAAAHPRPSLRNRLARCLDRFQQRVRAVNMSLFCLNFPDGSRLARSPF